MDNYENLISKESQLTLNKVIDISENLLPDYKKQKPWEYINHGVDLLTTDENLCAYMLAYGEMHGVKCRAAFQNFPFKKIISNIEIVDWGCGQGLAALVLLEMFGEHNIEKFVHKITLIEPSQVALKRAKINICQRVNGNAEVVAFDKYLPSYKSIPQNEISEFKSTYPYTIHIFSNILDIPSVNIEKLSKIIANCGRKNYIICIGPRNGDSWRIDKFTGYFHVSSDNCFSDIEQSIYSYTERTLHPISCKTKCFMFNNAITPWDGKNDYQQLASKQLGSIYQDDYTPAHILFKGVFPESLLTAFEIIHNQLDKGDKLFLRPNINGDTPDLVLFRPSVGIILFDIVDKEIPDISIRNDKELLDTHKTKELNNSLYNTVEQYASRLIDLHMMSLREKIIEHNNYLTVIKKVTVFTKYAQNEINQFFATGHPFVFLLSLESLNKNLFHTLLFDRRNYDFTPEIEKSFLDLISSRWHPYRDGLRIKLNEEQELLSISLAGVRRKIKGVSGSGKTQVLAFRAVNAMIRTGKRILVLTYNIALRNYIRFRINQIPADFCWNNVIILNYHEFFTSQAINSGRKVKNLNAYEDIHYFEGANVPKFAAIFIDEVQDYKENWLRIIQNTFLDKNGEFVVFGDKAQNIFHRTLDTNNELVIPGVPGVWNNSLDKSERFLNGKILNLSQKFQSYFMKLGNKSLSFYTDPNQFIKYAIIHSETPKEKYGQWCNSTIRKYGLAVDKTVVLASTSDLLQEIDFSYRNCSKKKTMTTFSSKEQYEITNKRGPAYFKLCDKALSRTKKLNFSMDSDCLKLSTIYSFKGWEADNVILFIQKPEPTNTATFQSKNIYEAPLHTLSPEVIYTAITRARKNLFIFNLENEQYDNFFKDNI